jgi:hypothetical protein
MIDAKKYIIRPATVTDIDFLVETVIQAEKSSTGNCGLANYFDVSVAEMRDYLTKIFNEEVDGCEFSVSSFIVIEYEGNVVAAMGGWLEGDNEDEMPSSLLKSNLLKYVMPKEKIIKSQENVIVTKDLSIVREWGTYQGEYSYIVPEHQGHFLMQDLLTAHIEKAKNHGDKVKKMQVHVFEHNKVVILNNKIMGFTIKKSFTSDNPKVLDFFPYNTILLMEKELN